MILMRRVTTKHFNLRRRLIPRVAVPGLVDGIPIEIGQLVQRAEQKMKQLKRKKNMESRNTIANTRTLIEKALNIYQLNK